MKINKKLIIDEADTCMPTCLNLYFNKPLFKRFKDFRKKQGHLWPYKDTQGERFTILLMSEVKVGRSVYLPYYVYESKKAKTGANKLDSFNEIKRKMENFNGKLSGIKFVLDYTYMLPQDELNEARLKREYAFDVDAILARRKLENEEDKMQGHVCMFFRDSRSCQLKFALPDGSLNTVPHDLKEARLTYFAIFAYYQYDNQDARNRSDILEELSRHLSARN